MGSGNSGRRDTERRDRAKAAIAVCGSGVPEKPPGLPADASAAWDWLVEQTSALAFAQDSYALEEAARLWGDQQRLHTAIQAVDITDPLYQELGRMRLANGRQLMLWISKFGLSPRDRQSLLRPESDVEEQDEFEKLLGG